jgi:hypothetical protein
MTASNFPRTHDGVDPAAGSATEPPAVAASGQGAGHA